MKKSKILVSVAAAVMMATALAAPTYALGWQDGVLKSWSFTYAEGAGVASVNVSDTNNTVNTTMNVGDTVVSKTGTIAWRGSYTNVTTFTAEAKTGYEITGVLENGREGDFVSTENGIQFSFTRKGAEIAGISGKNVTFSIQTQGKEYQMVYAEPNVGEDIEIGTCRTGEYIWQTVYKPDVTFVGWAFQDEKVDVVTDEMAAFGDAHNGRIYVTPIYE